ncbi:hypothetical protein GIB67_025401 [Kingdonia uniflora]|uniref:Homeobox domain-containing protein n=1 Tax=Kingdonia uniflora TaxID=39325 RepID=A0A7J7NBP2_9MAGN|nr:hypothetical protein GIB67_025401 [Kingdonia uniflora]
MAALCSSISVILSGTCGRRNDIFWGYFKPCLVLPRVPVNVSTSGFSRRKSNSAVTSKKKKKKMVISENDDAGEDLDEDAVEALFDMLEEELKNDLSLNGGDDEISEEDLARLEKELEEALGSDDDLLSIANSVSDSKEFDDDIDEDNDEEEEEIPLKLKNWQLRRLAYALKTGRRKTNIKSLAAELCLDRAVVLGLLRDPPPNLLLLSAALPDKIIPKTSEPDIKPVEPSLLETTVDAVDPELTEQVPVHMMQSRWSTQKRLKKVQIDTLERVYNRSKRPTNAMVSSIVHVTNLPKKRVVEWFEEKRAEDGVPHDRHPYQRSTSESIS